MAEFQSIFTGQEVDNTINKLRSWIAVDGTYPTVTISGVTYAVVWKSIPVSGTACYGLGLHPTTGRPYQIYYNGSSYSATALDADTKNTAGSSNSTSKLFLVGAGSQSSSAQTYSNSAVYTQNGKLYSNSEVVVTSSNLNSYLPRSGGTANPLTAPVYISHADLTFIGTKGAFGFRATNPSVTDKHLGQINLSKNFGGDGKQYGIQMSGLDITNNVYNQFRVYQLGIAYQQYNNASGATTNIFTVDTAGALKTLSDIYEGGTADANKLSSKYQAKLPTTTTAGKVLKSTTTAGTVTWADDLNTDTKNTAGSTNSDAKLFVIGAGTQAANPQTYSNSNVWIEDGALHSEGEKVVVEGDDISNLNNDSGYITGVEIIDLRNAG